MNRIFVLKDVAYAAKQGGGTVASANEVNLLAPGALALFTPQGTLLTAANAVATIPDIKEIMVASGRANDTLILPQVPRRVNNVNRGNYRSFVRPGISISTLSIDAADVGEAFIRVSDISFTSRFNTRLLTSSVYKRASDSVESVVDKLVAKLNNASESYVTASKFVSGGTREVSTITVTAAATVAGVATVDLNGVTTNLPLTASTIAINAQEIANTIDAMDGYSAVSDGVSKVTITAVASANLTDLATYAAGTATTSAATLATTVQGAAGTDFGITVVPTEDGVAIELSVGGLLEGDPIEVTTTPIYGIGGGSEILQMEKDFSVEEGNGNYIDYTAEWYSRPMEALTSSNYDAISLLWQGTHDTPSQTRNVMHNRAIIGCINGATNQNADEVMTLLALIFPTAYSATTGTETSTDTGTETDGVPGN